MNENFKEDLKQDAKNEVLELAEDVTIETIEHVFKFAKNALLKSQNALLAAIVPVLETVEKYLIGLADKIDGAEN